MGIEWGFHGAVSLQLLFISGSNLSDLFPEQPKNFART